jgi:hypothetical protein
MPEIIIERELINNFPEYISEEKSYLVVIPTLFEEIINKKENSLTSIKKNSSKIINRRVSS